MLPRPGRKAQPVGNVKPSGVAAIIQARMEHFKQTSHII